MPCEFRLRTWLPAMPVNTLLISQPAMSSASSIARWIDCTVDSMLTTTPRFRPRDGFEPRPITSSRSSADSSPTIATTFDVPMSRPTIKLAVVAPTHYASSIALPSLLYPRAGTAATAARLAGGPSRQPTAKPFV